MSAQVRAEGRPVRTTHAVTLSAAQRLASVAREEAARLECAVVVVIVDGGGLAVLVERMDDAERAAVDIALAKARTSAACRAPTAELGQLLGGGRLGLLAIEGLVPIEGGLPLVSGGEVVGAVGISGGSPHIDGAIADSARREFESWCASTFGE